MSNNHGDIVIEAPASYKWVEGTLTKITYVAEAGDVKYEPYTTTPEKQG